MRVRKPRTADIGRIALVRGIIVRVLPGGLVEKLVPFPVRRHFDAEFYTRTYPDVAGSRIPPLLHYVWFGAREGRKPSASFSPVSYRHAHGALMSPGQDPFEHSLVTPESILYRARRSRLSRDVEVVEPFFDASFYVRFNRLYDAAFASPSDAIRHYLRDGWKRGFDPSPVFSTSYYMSVYDDVATSGLNPLVHYVLSGRLEGRQCVPPRYHRATTIDVWSEFVRILSAEPADVPEDLSHRSDVTIVVPVYNAFEDLGNLLASLADTVSPDQPVVLVDDASPDERIVPLLDDWAAGRPGCAVIRQPKNGGYANSVNTGIERCRGHVVVLNTDVQLPREWLPRLMTPMDRAPDDVATVTPFSNTSSLTGYPTLASEAPLEAPLDVLDRAWRRMSGHLVELPSACGFCMALNRAAFDAVGGFASEVYGRGYYEETDWCQRAVSAGFRHLAATDLFVSHRPGSASFTVEQRVALSDENRPLFEQRNPDYRERERLYRVSDPLADIRRLGRLLLHAQKASQRALLVTHEWGGGIKTYIEARCKALLDENALVIIASVADGRIGLSVRVGDEQYALGTLPETAGLDSLVRLPLDRVEIHALHGTKLTAETVRAFTSGFRQSQLLLYAHDFLPACPTIHLLDETLAYCGIPDEARCAECLHRNRTVAYPVMTISGWRSLWRPLLRRADQIVAMDDSGKQILLKAFPDLQAEKFVVAPPKYEPDLRPVARRESGRLNIGVIGRISEHKGASVVRELHAFLAMQRGEAAVRVIGEWAHGAPPAGLEATGNYAVEDLPELVEWLGIDVVLFPSICPETFSFALSEVFAMELPVVALDIGAQGRRVRQYPKGVVCEDRSPENLFEALQKAAGL